MKQQPGSEVMPTCRSSSWAARRAAPSLMGAQLLSRWSGESKSSLRRNWTEKKAAITNINLTLEVVLSFKTLTYWRRWKNTFQQLESHTLSKSSLSYTSLPALLSEMMYNLQSGQIYYREMPWNMYIYIYIQRAGSPFQSLVVLRMTKSVLCAGVPFKNSLATLLL